MRLRHAPGGVEAALARAVGGVDGGRGVHHHAVGEVAAAAQVAGLAPRHVHGRRVHVQVVQVCRLGRRP